AAIRMGRPRTHAGGRSLGGALRRPHRRRPPGCAGQRMVRGGDPRGQHPDPGRRGQQHPGRRGVSFGRGCAPDGGARRDGRASGHSPRLHSGRRSADRDGRPRAQWRAGRGRVHRRRGGSGDRRQDLRGGHADRRHPGQDRAAAERSGDGGAADLRRTLCRKGSALRGWAPPAL
ncbi:MAG: Carbonic anhydrase, gamma class, partial [uncultured Sphingomonas sp.]